MNIRLLRLCMTMVLMVVTVSNYVPRYVCKKQASDECAMMEGDLSEVLGGLQEVVHLVKQM